MVYRETKVYFDGSHYIAIPHTTRPPQKRSRTFEEYVEVKEIGKSEPQQNSTPTDIVDVPFAVAEETEAQNDTNLETNVDKSNENEANSKRYSTRKELFEEAYRNSLSLPKYKRRKSITDALRPYFNNEERLKAYVQLNMERKARNLMCRRIRMTRKANLQEFNYFCTFTYDGARHTEDSFKKTLKKCLANLTNRKDWKYMGVWERSPQKQRLHFHGIFYIPEGTMPGLLCTRRDYNFSKKRMVEIYTNTYFEERLGRNDFEPIEDRYMLGSSLAYLMKYIEKSGEKIVYSKGLPPYFIPDIMENDVVCFIGQEENKLLLYDDFLCFDDGICVGPVSSDTIKQLRKAYE